MTSLEPLERVVSTLARDPNLPRVKKLLYCACYGVWEDNAERLNQVSLQEIVQGVWERSPTLEALQFQLNRVVKTLNKPVAYAHVANGVLQVLNELYFDTYDITQPVMVNRVQFPLSIQGSPRPGNLPPGNAPSANPGFAKPAPEPGHYGSGANGHHPEDLGAQYYSNGAPAYRQQQGYGNPAYGNHQGYPAQGNGYGAHPAPPAYATGSHGQQPPAFPHAPAPVGYGSASRSPAGQNPVGQNPVGNSQAGYAQPVAAPGDAPATHWFVGGQQSHSPSSLTPAQLSAQTAVRAHVLQSLSQDQEQRRMKKLLVCVCHNHWENDRSHLAAVDWELLLDDARQLMPTLQSLEHVLEAIVHSLSKPMEYQRVAQLLLDIVTPLYEQERPDETQFFGVTPESSNAQYDDSRDETQINTSHTAPSQAGPTYSAANASNFRNPAPPVQPRIASTGVYGNQPSRRTSDSFPDVAGGGTEANDGPPTGLFAPQLPVSPMDSKYPPRTLPTADEDLGDARTDSTIAIAQVVGQDAPTAYGMGAQDGGHAYKDAQDWEDQEAQALRGDDSGITCEEEAENDEFTLRLSLMRYANPLMSKVVLFSALYRLFRFSEQDWSELRHHSLASLMAELEERYPNLIDLEMKLCGVAEQLEVPEQAMQTAAALLKVLKPRYDSAKQAPARNMGLAIASPAPASTAGPTSGKSPEIRQSAAPAAALVSQAERATAIQFGPDGAEGADDDDEGRSVGSSHGGSSHGAVSIAPTFPNKHSTSESAVIAEVIPSDEVSYEALISDDLEADLAQLAASLEDDGPSLSHDS